MTLVNQIKAKQRWLLVLLLLAATGCDQTGTIKQNNPPTKGPTIASADRPILRMTAENASDDETVVSLQYIREAGRPGPRLAEIVVSYSENLEYLTSEEGKALVDAGKKLIVQNRESGKLRLVIFASENLLELDSGELARLRFRKHDGVSSRVEILTQKPIFAPEEANDGLLVSDPIEF